jgi:Mn-dependent DtxR family transcriptional regulator
MSLTRLQLRLLVALLDLAQANRPANVRRLAEALDVRLSAAACALATLDELGLVHAARVRLSMGGLVVATAARARLAELGVALPQAA